MKKKINPWIFVVAAIVLLSFFILYIQSESGLNASTGKTILSPTVPTTEPDYNLTPYSATNDEYKAYIPSDWIKVTKSGFPTFIHSPSATSCQIKRTDYSPLLLTRTFESMSASLSQNGYVMNSFEWLSSTQSVTTYQKMNDNETSTIFYEITYFDKDTCMTTVYTIESIYYDNMNDIVLAMIDKFKWIPDNPFPVNTVPYFCEVGKFEFVYPSSWSSAQSDNSYLFQDSATNATYAVAYSKSDVTYNGVSKLDYTSFASKSRSNFILQSFNSNDNVIFAESSYISNNTEMRMIQYLIATGEYEYTITFETPVSHLETHSKLVSDLISCFRYY